MIRILANDGIEESGKKALASAGIELVDARVAQDQLADYLRTEGISGLLVRSATQVRKELIDACPGLKLIGRGGVGMDNIDVEYARSKGLHVVNTPAASSDSVAELVLAHLFGLIRFLPQSNREMPLSGETHFKELKKAYAAGIEAKGKTLGIVGFGRIGKALGARAVGLGMNVRVAERRPGEKHEVTWTLGNGQVIPLQFVSEPLEAVLAESDFVSVHVPGGGDKPLIGAAELGAMKRGAILINAARGGVVDEVALLAALDSGQLSGAALDVFVNEPEPAVQVLMHDKISLSPHIGASTAEAQERIGSELAGLVIEALGTVRA